MVAVVQMGLGEGVTVVLVDPDETKVVEYFTVKSFTNNKEAVVEDSSGRIFYSQGEDRLWIHPLVMVEFIDGVTLRSTKHGYQYLVRLHVNNLHRIHYLSFLKDKNPGLLCSLPMNLQNEV